MKLKIIISALVVLLFCYLLKPYPLEYKTHHRNTASKKNRFAVSELPNIDSIKTITSKNVNNIKAKRKIFWNSEKRKNRVLSQLEEEIALAQKEITTELNKDKEDKNLKNISTDPIKKKQNKKTSKN
ncbi:hypothetical protein [Apibacter sp. B3239]|uniref:hypothetical protein n=2 Tax=unclassified Apibacter TaxID=2630820 RepID=UPI00136E0B73|nr:hypothetical protein [Apibacter sp. B3239]MXP12333.1 hypothetical protein [Apibacter sp. B3239]